LTIITLESYHTTLKGIYLVTGQGVTSNVYVFSGETITIVDSGNGAVENRIIPQLKEIFSKIPNVSKTILTHFHFDHIGGLAELMESYVLDILIQREEVPFLRDINPMRIKEINAGGKIVVGEYLFDIIHTPGHSPGSVCLYEKNTKCLISGDTVFPNGSFGRSDFPFGNHEDLLQSLKRLTEIDVKMLLPGHGLPTFSAVNQQIKLSFMTAKSYF
jgi:glyoxylase-like metal-dependent hydrolase (beta-lactamase superfamily II)